MGRASEKVFRLAHVNLFFLCFGAGFGVLCGGAPSLLLWCLCRWLNCIHRRESDIDVALGDLPLLRCAQQHQNRAQFNPARFTAHGALRVHNPDRLSFKIQSGDPAQAPTGFMEIVGDDFQSFIQNFLRVIACY